MQARHVVIAVLLATSGAAHAAGQAVGPSDTVVIPMPAPLVLEPAPVANPPLAPAPDATDVPEPSSIALLLAGAIGAGALHRRRRAK